MGDHEPTLARSARHGCWCWCTCGDWTSRVYTTVTGAHLAFGQHLLLAEAERRTVLVDSVTNDGDRWTITGRLADGTRVRLQGEPRAG